MDLILFNGKVVTMDEENIRCEAVAIRGDKIYAVGDNEDVLSLKNDNTRLVDLKGKLVLPGFTDSHMHLLGYASSLQKVDLRDAYSIDEVIGKTKKFIKERNIPKGHWVLGTNWNHENFKEKRFLNREDLDKISKEHPISLIRACYHVYSVNSKALEVLGIKGGNIPKVQGGKVEIDNQGIPTGVLTENAVWLADNAVNEPDLEELKDMIEEAAAKASEQGITTVFSDDFAYLPSRDYKKIIKAYRELIDEGRLKVRINQQCRLADMDILEDFLNEGWHNEKGDKNFKLGPLKLICDGSLGARTAYLSYSYKDKPSTFGMIAYSQDELDELIITAHKEGMQISTHCIGDKAMYMVFDSIEKAQKLYPRKNARHTIIHAQITDEVLINKFKELDVIANVQPIFLNYDLHVVEERIGKTKAKYTYNWKTMLDNDIHLTFGSDCPIEAFDVLPNVYSAVTRKDLNGYPKGGWLPEQKLSVYEAVYGFTMGGAYASFEENIKGSITPGKFADIVVLEEDIFNVEEEHIKDVKVETTILGGKTVYTREKE